ncbi:MAG: hypothetical protein SF187_26955 [Deltaproteobacteria bacterium]|nr:hypothetical protein [Deltaproteobacteria bacterium]
MAKASRSPVLGFNHNVRYHGRVYHVQTEDSGVSHNRIFTHLFFAGTIIASKRSDYPEDVLEDQVKALMQTQHKAILKELKQGVYDTKILTFFASIGEVGFLDMADAAAAEAAPPAQPDVPMAAAPPPMSPDATYSDLRVDASYGEMHVGPSVAEPEAYTEPYPSYAPPPATAQPAAAMADLPALDLDALPPIAADEGPLPDVIVEPAPAPGNQGLGVYSMRGPGRERPFDGAFSNTPERVPSPIPSARPPVVVIRPPVAKRIVPRPASSSPPPGGVIVQRTVVVGVGGTGPDGQRPRRPRPAVPYVVKEGSHPIVQNPRAAQVAPPIPSSPAAAAPATISDKSLDEVILAYLSQDNDTKR